ncbi:MAG: hypothetical protein KF886_22275 [Candidatus Hydrogenedentes bacterium]|nr:hypothetical protein [Candidatus Hydrogenedentota bacterium]
MRLMTTAATLGFLLALSAQAHFIFLELPPNAPDVAHMRFAEEPLEPTTPDLQERSAPMVVKTDSGAEVAFAGGEDARVASVSPETTALLGSLDYGVIERGGEFLLVYYAKAARNAAEAGAASGLALEVLADVKDGSLTVTVLHGGKPASGAELVVNLPGADEQATTTTNAAGQASFPIEPGGWVGLRARVVESRSGAHDGKAYTEVRSYSTLTFPYIAD